MTWMDHEEKMKITVKNAQKAKTLSGSRLVFREDIYDTDLIHMYEPVMSGSGLVMCCGTIIRDSLSNDLASMLSGGSIVIVEFNVIGIASHNTGKATRG